MKAFQTEDDTGQKQRLRDTDRVMQEGRVNILEEAKCIKSCSQQHVAPHENDNEGKPPCKWSWRAENALKTSLSGDGLCVIMERKKSLDKAKMLLKALAMHAWLTV